MSCASSGLVSVMNPARARSQLTCKPGSVGPRCRDVVTIHLRRLLPARSCNQPGRHGLETGWAEARVIPIWSCSRWGLPCGLCRQTPGALLPHPFTLTCPKTGGLLSVALSLGSPPAAFRRHRVSMEPGLSSSMQLPACQRSPGQLARPMCGRKCLPSSRQQWLRGQVSSGWALGLVMA